MSKATSHSAGWQPASYYPDPAIHALDPSFEKYWLKLSAIERLATGLPLGRGPGVVRRRALSAVERHPEQPHPAVGRGDRRRQRLPQALELRQRQHARPPGTPRDLRARRPARHAHRVRRHDHRADRSLRGQAPELAERHRGEVRRLDLVHRPALRHPRLLRGRQGRARDRRRTSIASIGETGKPPSSPKACSGPTGSPSRRTRRSSTSSNRAACRRKILAYDVVDGGDKIANRRVLIDAGPGTPDGMRATSTAICGAAGAWAIPNSTACVVFTPDGELIGRIDLPERCANLCFGGLQAQPAVHGGEPVDLRAVRQHAGRAGGIISLVATRVAGEANHTHHPTFTRSGFWVPAHGANAQAIRPFITTKRRGRLSRRFD